MFCPMRNLHSIMTSKILERDVYLDWKQADFIAGEGIHTMYTPE